MLPFHSATLVKVMVRQFCSQLAPLSHPPPALKKHFWAFRPLNIPCLFFLMNTHFTVTLLVENKTPPSEVFKCRERTTHLNSTFMISMLDTYPRLYRLPFIDSISQKLNWFFTKLANPLMKCLRNCHRANTSFVDPNLRSLSSRIV